jgi:hypothetical protein
VIKKSALLASSLLLNVGLAAFLALRPTGSPAGAAPQKSEQAPETRTAPEASAARPISDGPGDATRTVIDAAPATPTSSARRADDVRALVAELRRRGVDEGTVRRLGVAHAERQFRVAARDLLAPREKREYWQSPTERVIEPAQLREFQRLRRDRVQMLAELFGDVAAEATEHNTVNHYRAGSDTRYEFAPPDKRLALVEYFERDSIGVGRTPVQRLISEHTPTPARELEQFKHIHAMLGAGLFEDYLLQASAISSRLSYELSAFQPTRAEFDELVRIEHQVLLEQPAGLLATTRLDPEAGRKIEQARNAAVRDAFGDARYTDFERSSDPAYRHLDHLARELGLGQSAARAAFAHVERARKEVLSVAGDAPNLADTKIQDALLKIRKETGDRIAREFALQSMSDQDQMMFFGPALSIHPQELAQRMYRWQ